MLRKSFFQKSAKFFQIFSGNQMIIGYHGVAGDVPLGVLTGVIGEGQHNDTARILWNAAERSAIQIWLCSLDGAEAKRSREILTKQLRNFQFVHRIHLISWKIIIP